MINVRHIKGRKSIERKKRSRKTKTNRDRQEHTKTYRKTGERDLSSPGTLLPVTIGIGSCVPARRLGPAATDITVLSQHGPARGNAGSIGTVGAGTVTSSAGSLDNTGKQSHSLVYPSLAIYPIHTVMNILYSYITYCPCY